MQLAFIRHQALLNRSTSEAIGNLSAAKHFTWINSSKNAHFQLPHTHTPFHTNTNEQFCQQSPQTSHISADHQFIEKEKALSSRMFFKQCCSGQQTQTFRVSTFHLVIACGSRRPLMHSQRMFYYRDVARFFEQETTMVCASTTLAHAEDCTASLIKGWALPAQHVSFLFSHSPDLLTRAENIQLTEN